MFTFNSKKRRALFLMSQCIDVLKKPDDKDPAVFQPREKSNNTMILIVVVVGIVVLVVVGLAVFGGIKYFKHLIKGNNLPSITPLEARDYDDEDDDYSNIKKLHDDGDENYSNIEKLHDDDDADDLKNTG